MTVSREEEERVKLGRLLSLANEQIEALNSDDMVAFDRILAAKVDVVASLKEIRSLIATDSGLADVAAQIQEYDRVAERSLYEKSAAILKKLVKARQQSNARSAYLSSEKPRGMIAARMPHGSSQFVDRKS